MARNEMRKLMETIEAIERGEVLEEGVKEWVQAAILSAALAGSPQAMAGDSGVTDGYYKVDTTQSQIQTKPVPNHLKSVVIDRPYNEFGKKLYDTLRSSLSQYKVYNDSGSSEQNISIKKGNQQVAMVRIYKLDDSNVQVTYGAGDWEQGNSKFKDSEVQSIGDIINYAKSLVKQEDISQRALITAVNKNKQTFDASKFVNNNGRIHFSVKPVYMNGRISTDYTLYVADNDALVDDVYFTIRQDELDTIKDYIKKMASTKIPPFDGKIDVARWSESTARDDVSISFSVNKEGDKVRYIMFVSGPYTVEYIMFQFAANEIPKLMAKIEEAEAKGDEIIEYLRSTVE